MAIPFTTAFTPAPQCTNEIFLSGTYNLTAGGYILTLGPPVSAQSQSCFPSGWQASASFSFSPALNCPTGYTVAEMSTVSTANSLAETQQLCCPSGYGPTVVGETQFPGQLCTRHVTSAGSLVVTSVDQIALTTSTQTISVLTRDGLNAYGVRIAHRASDLPVSTTSSTAVPGSTVSPTAASATSNPSSTAIADNSSGGLSTGAKAGIGVGVAVGALAIIAFLAFLFWRRRRHSQAADAAAMSGVGATENGMHAQQSPSGQTDYSSPATYQGGMVQQPQQSAYEANGYANGTPVHEGQGYGWNKGKGINPNQNYSPVPTQSQGAPAELPNTATMAPVEMDASSTVHR